MLLAKWPRRKINPETIDPERFLRLVTLRMPFGKYQGRLIADIPGHYLNWMAREGFPPGELGRLLALMHEIDHNGLSSLLDPLRPPTDEQLEQNPGNSPRRSNGKRPKPSTSAVPKIR